MADEPESERTEDADAHDAPADESTDEAERAAETASDGESDDSGSTETDDEATQTADDGSGAPETDEANDDDSDGSDESDTTSDGSDDADAEADDADAEADDADDSGSTETDTESQDDDGPDEGGETGTDADDEDDASDNLQQVSSDRGDDEERPPDEADGDDDDADVQADDDDVEVKTGDDDAEDDGDSDDSDADADADREGEESDAEADDDAEGEESDEEPEYVEDASLDDDFPVAGMSAEDVAWDPEETTSADELGLDEEEVDTPGDADEDDGDFVGVKPEKQEIDDSFWGEGPDSDQEMPLADHIEEMMRRLGVVFVIAGAVSLTVLGLAQTIEWLPTAVDIIDILWNHNIPGAPEDAGRRPRIYGPLELVLTKLKVAGLAGILVGLPAFVYETYLFMRPGLYPRERKYYLAAVPTSLILAAIGMTFAHFVVLPVIFDYFTSYTEGTATIAFGLSETFNLIILLMGYMAIVFQIPLFIMLAIMMNLVTRIWLEDKRLLFWGAFAGLAFLVSPDPTGMAPIIIAATMIVLYEGTLALLRWTGN